MDEYIKRKDALCRFTFENGCRIPEVNIDNFQNSVPLKDIKRVLLEIPSADVVEVVRYKDCKWHDSVDGPTAKIEQLQSELEQVKRERDAAVNEIKACYDIQGIDDYYPIYDLGICMCCSHYSDVVDRANGEELACYDCQNASNWQWRGVKEGKHDV